MNRSRMSGPVRLRREVSAWREDSVDSVARTGYPWCSSGSPEVRFAFGSGGTSGRTRGTRVTMDLMSVSPQTTLASSDPPPLFGFWRALAGAVRAGGSLPQHCLFRSHGAPTPGFSAARATVLSWYPTRGLGGRG